MPKKNVKDVAYDRTVILGTAQQLVSSDRQKEHGDASKNFAMVAFKKLVLYIEIVGIEARAN